MEFTSSCTEDGILIVSDVEQNYLFVARDFEMTGIDAMAAAIAKLVKVDVNQVEYVDYRYTRNNTVLYRWAIFPF